jgi:predicted adenine nucleotide alpha hydrolase (AANH) superfamily ATPase
VRLLLHICCAPCAIHPVECLRGEGVAVMGFFYRHNIHPFSECLRREEALKAYAAGIDLQVIYQEGYELERFLQQVVFREAERCNFCYHDRLRTTALMARRGRFEGFSSTLLYSKFQNHERIAAIGEAVGKTVGVPFVYRDFRPGWKAGIEASKKLGLYRQQYCGCIYSEKDRFYHPPKS